ncbi:MAG: primosomal protein N' [Oscillospiraceae bacterium]
MIVAVAVEKVLYKTDRLFYYNVPPNIKICLGQTILVPFGTKNIIRRAFVFNILEDENRVDLKEVYSAVENAYVLTEEQIKIAIYMVQNLFCTYFEALSVITPYALAGKLKVGFELNTDAIQPFFLFKAELLKLAQKHGGMISAEALAFLSKKEQNELCQAGVLTRKVWFVKNLKGRQTLFFSINKEELTNSNFTSKQQQVLMQLKDEVYYTKEELQKIFNISNYMIAALVKKKALKREYKIIETKEVKWLDLNGLNTNSLQLTKNQQFVQEGIAQKIDQREAGVSLLFGITGSGKSEIFVKLAEKVIKSGKSVLILVPEIGLTVPMADHFSKYFKGIIAVLHSGLKASEKFYEWQRIKDGETCIIIGTRSAVFSPILNIGLIIVDEEQDQSYLSERKPLYSAIEVAKFRAFYNNCQLILASATPSITSFYKAKNGVYSLFELNERYNKSELPHTQIVNLSDTNEQEETAIIGNVLKNELQANLSKGEQSIVLIGRRGYSTSVRCRGCGNVAMCPNCDIGLVYHKSNKTLRCHYCGYTTDARDICLFCGSNFIEYNGFGIEKVEAQLRRLDGAKILRMDSDVITSSEVFKQKLKAFINNEYNIMVGTQIVAKGLNLNNVTLVGVVGIDQSLYCSDFRGYEQAFALLTQVIGRAGRFNKLGRAVIQTRNANNELFTFVQKNNYQAFFEQEIAIRSSLNLPPVGNLMIIGFVGKDAKSTLAYAEGFFKILKGRFNIICQPPTPANQPKLNGNYRFKIMIFNKNNTEFRNKLRIAFKQYLNSSSLKNVRMFVDVNIASNF